MANNPDELFENILDRLLDAVPSDVDKREGSIIYNALAPVALELQSVYEELEDVINDSFADTASLDYLIRRAAERGITWHEATQAVINARLVFSDVESEPSVIGSVFALENASLLYDVAEKVSYSDGVGLYRLVCEESGTAGNVARGSLIVEDAEDDALFENLITAEITGIEAFARNDEDVEAFRLRYFDGITNEAFGGNIADYKNKALEQDIVGAVQIDPAWNGPGTVRLRVLNAGYNIPSTEEINLLQNTFDPSPQGEGYGLAPIGHNVSVVPATTAYMNIMAAVTISTGHTWDDLYDDMEAQCVAYLLSLRKEWQTATVTVSPGALAYLMKQNIEDVIGCTCNINGQYGDFTLQADEVPVFGSLVEG